MRRILIAITVTFATAACAPIQHYDVPVQALNTELRAGPGDVVFRVDKTRDLENVYGKADAFGRKTNEGYSELRFVGLQPDGSIAFYRADLTIQTNETTMSRTPFSTTFTSGSGTASGTRSGNNFNASSNISAVSTTIAPTSDYHIPIPGGAIPITLPSGSKSLIFEGKTIDILDVQSGFITYRVHQ